jgi:hypothetical protein
MTPVEAMAADALLDRRLKINLPAPDLRAQDGTHPGEATHGGQPYPDVIALHADGDRPAAPA